jgi:hypothetical protein
MPKPKKRKTKKKKQRSKKIIYSDQWGEIAEYTNYRDTRPGKKGRYVSAKIIKRLKKHKPEKEVIQYRSVNGKRVGVPIYKRLPSKKVLKTTAPGAFENNEGLIYDSLKDTNLFTEVSRAERGLINIRGISEDGETVRLQADFIFGDKNRDLQLTYQIRMLLAKAGYRTQYNIEIVKCSGKTRNISRKLIPVNNLQVTVTLMR